jgi:hypothetical protein
MLIPTTAPPPSPRPTSQEIEIKELKKQLLDQNAELDHVIREKERLSNLPKRMRSSLPRSLQESVSRCGGLSDNYRMSFIAGDMDLTREGPKTFNDCDSLTKDHSPHILHIFRGNATITGVEVMHKNGKVLGTKLTHRVSASKESFTLQEGEKVVKFHVEASYKNVYNISLVDRIRLETDRGNVFDVVCSDRSSAKKNSWTEMAPDTNFSLKGFWGQSGDAVDRLGCVWGKD